MITEVDHNLWMGGVPMPAVSDYFKSVLDLYTMEDYYIPEGVDVMEYPMMDSSALPRTHVLDYLSDWVNKKRAYGPVLVHCQAGLNRSGLLTAYSMMKYNGMSAREAINTLRTARSSSVLCNREFERWLLAREGGH